MLVKIKDVEDQPPEFIVASPVVRVPEDAPTGTTVTQGLYEIISFISIQFKPIIIEIPVSFQPVKAIDGDRGVNNLVRYAISPNTSSPFEIDENLGIIVTTTKLDREDARNRVNAAYILEIIAIERNSKVKVI